MRSWTDIRETTTRHPTIPPYCLVKRRGRCLPWSILTGASMVSVPTRGSTTPCRVALPFVWARVPYPGLSPRSGRLSAGLRTGSVRMTLARWLGVWKSRIKAPTSPASSPGSSKPTKPPRKPTGPEPLQNLSEDLRSAFAVASYVTTALEADVELRLDESGNLADEFGKDTFQLRMQVGIRDLGDRTQARVRVRVPDFLVSGNIAHLLLEALRGEEALEDIRNGFRETPLGRRMEDESRRIEIEDVKDFLEGSETTSMVFRTKRKAKHHNEREDTDILAIRQPLGKFDAREELLAIVRAKFTLERQEVEDDSTVKKVESIKVLHFGSLDGAEGTLDKDDVKYFVRLAAELHRWQKVLA